MLNADKILMSAGVADPTKIKQAFQLLIRTGLRLLKADEGSLLVYRKEEGDLQFVGTVGGNNQLEGQTVPIGRGITGMAAMTCEIQTASRACGNDFFNVANDGSPNSVIAAPIMLDDELIGVITAVSFDDEKSFSTEDCQAFSLLAELGAIIITQGQELANYESQQVNPLTEQDALELQAARQVVDLVKQHPGKAEKVLQILTLLQDF